MSERDEIQWLKSRIDFLEKRITWVERLLMTEGRELFVDTATHFSNWDKEKDV